MSGITGSKLNIRGSGRVAKLGTDGQVLTSAGVGLPVAFEDIAAGISWQAVETGSTMTAVAGNGYPINTTSNACTITLPASASNGDQIIFTDYARTWGTNGITIDSNGLNFQSFADTTNPTYATDGQSVHIVYSDATQGWIPTTDEDVADVPSKGNDEGIFGFGTTGSVTAITNLVSNSGVVASDTSGVGTARRILAACEYGDDKAIFAYGTTGSVTNLSNLVSNAGVVASDTSGVGTSRYGPAGCKYGDDKGIFAYGYAGGNVNMSNLVSSSGVVGSDVTGVGTARHHLDATEFGGDKGIFFGGHDGSGYSAVTNLVSNAGVIATDVAAVVGVTGRESPGACGYDYDKAIFGYGYDDAPTAVSNLVSNVGVIAADTTGVGTARYGISATQYGGDKGIFAYGFNVSRQNISNLVSNVGVIATDTAGVGTARNTLAACSFN